jgi:lambda family phage portal protein
MAKGILATIRDTILPLRGRPRNPAATPPERMRVRTDYMRGGRGVLFNKWRPFLREASTEVSQNWDLAASRALDIIHNSGWIAGAIDQAVANTVGIGLRLKSTPDIKTLNMDQKTAGDWTRLVENRFALWANSPIECDIEGRRHFGQMQGAAFRSYIATGEILSELPWNQRPGTTYGTKVRLIPPQRLSRRTDLLRNLIGGVRMDKDGFPVSYLAIKVDPFFTNADAFTGFGTGSVGFATYEVPARDGLNRPRVVHVFDGAIGTVRGITPLVPALQVAKQFDQLSDATLMASIIQTVFAATITTPDQPTEDAVEGLLTPQEQSKMRAEGMSPFEAWFEAQSGWYDTATMDVGLNGRIAHLFPGQKMEFHKNEHPNTTYKEFSAHLLRELARCLGLTYESATGDYEHANYSSARMASGEIFEITRYRRRNIIQPFCQPAYEAWLEEEIMRGPDQGIPFPGGIEAFVGQRAAACAAEWRGTPKPQADDYKLAKSHAEWYAMGVVPAEFIANDLGLDIDDVYRQRAHEYELRQLYKLPEPAVIGRTGSVEAPPDVVTNTDTGQGGATP